MLLINKTLNCWNIVESVEFTTWRQLNSCTLNGNKFPVELSMRHSSRRKRRQSGNASNNWKLYKLLSMLFNSVFPKYFCFNREQSYVNHTRKQLEMESETQCEVKLFNFDDDANSCGWTTSALWLNSRMCSLQCSSRETKQSRTIISTLLSLLSHVTRFETWKRVETWFKVKWKHYLSSFSHLDYLQLHAWKARKNLSSQLKARVYRDEFCVVLLSPTMLGNEPDFMRLKAETHWLKKWALKRWDGNRLWWEFKILNNRHWNLSKTSLAAHEFKQD